MWQTYHASCRSSIGVPWNTRRSRRGSLSAESFTHKVAMTTTAPAPIGSATALAPAACPRVEANLSLDFKREPASGHTILAASTQQPPLRMIRAFTREDGSALAHLHNVSGGLLGGDSLGLSAAVGRGSRAQITTTGATRIYRPRADAASCTQENHVNIAEEAVLEYVPDAIIPYAGVRFLQTSEIHLAEGAGLFWWEVLAPGREARGELFKYERVEMKTEIFAAGRLIAAERVRLEPKSRALDSLARLGEFRYWVTFY